MSEESLMVMYAVRNKEGKYFRAIGYGGSGSNWVDSIKQAKIYPKPGGARGRVTWFATHHPKFGVPELVELHVTKVVAVDETTRVKKSQDRKAREEAEREQREARWGLEQAQRKMDEARLEIQRLTPRTA